MISDFSWATMHAALKAFNGEDMSAYSARVFRLAKEEITSDDPNKLWLASCTSHTMHRFVRALKVKVSFAHKDARELAVFCFLLLLNCVDLYTASKLFSLMVTTFLTNIRLNLKF